MYGWKRTSTSRETKEPSHEVPRQQRWMVTHQKGRPTSSNSSENDDTSRTQYEESTYQRRTPGKRAHWVSRPPTISRCKRWSECFWNASTSRSLRTARTDFARSDPATQPCGPFNGSGKGQNGLSIST